MNDVLSNFAAKIAELQEQAQKPVQTYALGRRTVLVRLSDGAILDQDVPPEPADAALDAIVMDLASLQQWCRRADVCPEPGIIHVSHRAATKAQNGPLRGRKAFEWCHRPFYGAFLPPDKAHAEGWLMWWDRISHGVSPELVQRVNAAVTSISATSAKSLTINQSGAAVQVTVNSENGVKTAAPLPKRFVARIPFGDPAFTTEVCFVLRLSTRNDEVVFETSIDEHFEGTDPYGKHAAWACEQLQPLAAEGWTVLRTP